MSGYTDELLLTTVNIVHIKRGTFGGTKAVTPIPIKAVKVNGDRAQAFYGRNPSNNSLQLQIYLKNGQELAYGFNIDGTREVARWVNEINKLATGDPYNVVYDESKMQGTVGTVAGILKSAFGMDSEPQLAQKLSSGAKRSTQSCIGCGAPVTGVVGQMVRCEYCDMEQMIK